MLPHLNAAYNLARWMCRNDHDAEDLVQESFLRAYRFFPAFQGGDGRGWLLTIVRNTCFTWLRRSKERGVMAVFDERIHDSAADAADPEVTLVQAAGNAPVRDCLEALPPEYREVMVMRELEDLSYKEIAEAISTPLGTVMSRLSRARKRMEACLRLRRAGSKA